MKSRTGLDALVGTGFEPLIGKRVGLLINQASCSSDGRHVLESLRGNPKVTLGAIFGPQHGLFGHQQDNMIEWEGKPDPRFGAPIFSLYGERRQPTAEMLSGLDLLVVDLFDVGSRNYTFAWTMAQTMEVCAEIGLPMLILDRPNPITGTHVEGPYLEPEFKSFVGWHSLPIRHGLTLGELAFWLKANFYPKAEIDLLMCQHWPRSNEYELTELPWFTPSPNMPSARTARVYPGACLLEGTHLSEARGTTRPFEQFGAAWIDGWKLADRLNARRLQGVHFRPIQYQPTFHKFGNQLCEGCFVHVTDAPSFRPVRTYLALLQEAFALWKELGEPKASFVAAGEGGAWQSSELTGFWKQPPYEYETEKMPIDILWGSPALRTWVEGEGPALDGIMADAEERWLSERRSVLRYP